MRNVLFIHDSYSSNSEPWIVSVLDELKVQGYSVFAPKFPTPIGQDYISWKVLFDSYKQYLNNETIFVGVGVGCAFIVRYLSEHPDISVARTVLIAPFLTPLANPSEQLLAQSFLMKAYDPLHLKPQLGKLVVVTSDNDLIVDYDMSRQVAELFGGTITKLSGKGHFRAVNGVRLLPEVVEVITAQADVVPAVSVNPTQNSVQPTPISPTPAPITPSGQTTLHMETPPLAQGITPTEPFTLTPDSIASAVTETKTTDVKSLQKMLDDLKARGIGVTAPQQSAHTVSEPAQSAPQQNTTDSTAILETLPQQQSQQDDITSQTNSVLAEMKKSFAPTMATSQPGSIPVPKAPESTIPTVSNQSVEKQSVLDTAPNTEVIGEVENIGSMQVSHSLINDFQKSLINANASEVSKTLNDYRRGKEFAKQNSAMKVFKVIVSAIGVLLILLAGYFAYRVYFFHETLPSITQLDIPPMNAVSEKEVVLKSNNLLVDNIREIVDGITDVSISNPGDVGVVKLFDNNGEKLTASRVIRAIGGNTPSTIYNKLGSFYALGAIKEISGTTNFAVFTLDKPEQEALNELKIWEPRMQEELIELFLPQGTISSTTHDFTFETRTLSNNTVRVLVAKRKMPTFSPTPAIIEELARPVIEKNGEPSITTPVLPLGSTVDSDVSRQLIDAVSVEYEDDSAGDSIAGDELSQELADTVASSVGAATGTKSEENIIEIFKISAEEQTAIQRSKNSLIVAASSPIFKNNILPGDIFSFESSDKEDTKTVVDENGNESEVIAPIIGGASNIFQITNIIQQGAKTELTVKPLGLAEATEMINKKVMSYILPNGASIIAPEITTEDTAPFDVFGYSIVNGKVLVFSANVEQIQSLADIYFNQKKSIFDLFE